MILQRERTGHTKPVEFGGKWPWPRGLALRILCSAVPEFLIRCEQCYLLLKLRKEGRHGFIHVQ